MTGSIQADLPLQLQASTSIAGTAKPASSQQAGNRRPWPSVLRTKGTQQEGRALATRKKIPRLGDRPKPAHQRDAGPRDLLTYVAVADVSPEVRDALASFGRAIEAGFLAKQQRSQMPRQAWWNRD
jgi:hypothetical protein